MADPHRQQLRHRIFGEAAKVGVTDFAVVITNEPVKFIEFVTF
jgi:hypothetical protein